jgi:hypothetical protein
MGWRFRKELGGLNIQWQVFPKSLGRESFSAVMRSCCQFGDGFNNTSLCHVLKSLGSSKSSCIAIGASPLLRHTRRASIIAVPPLILLSIWPSCFSRH